MKNLGREAHDRLEETLKRVPSLESFVVEELIEYSATGKTNALRNVKAWFRESCRPQDKVLDALIKCAPEKVPALLDTVFDSKKHKLDPDLSQVLLERGGAVHELRVAEAFTREIDLWRKFKFAKQLCWFNTGKYRKPALAVARECLASEKCASWHCFVWEWLIQNFDRDVFDEMQSFVSRKECPDEDLHVRERWHDVQTAKQILDKVVRSLERDSLPILQAAIAKGYREVRLAALFHLARLNDNHAHDALIQKEILRGLDDEGSWLHSSGYWGNHEQRGRQEKDQRFLEVAALVPIEPLAERVWSYLCHKSLRVREAAARTLAKLHDAALSRAAAALDDKRLEIRKAATLLVATIGTKRALELLQKRFEIETDEEVRDAILAHLDRAWAASGRTISVDDIKSRIKRAAAHLEAPCAAWIDEKKLPPLTWLKGGRLDFQTVRYLLYRQSRCKEVRADAEARPLIELINRDKSGDFALVQLQQFLGSRMEASDRWALVLAGLLGDDRVVPTLVAQVQKWTETSRAQMAEYAAKAIALRGSDAALLALDSLALRYRTKYKNVGQAALDAFATAAELRGVTPDELGDLVIPSLGFEPGKPRLIECGQTTIEARIGLDFKLRYVDRQKSKQVASLPKSAPAPILTELKELAATLREVSRGQVRRLENLLVRQYRWTAQHWRELYLKHPLLMPFAVRLVWGTYSDKGSLQGTFRALEDGTLTAVDDTAFSLPKTGRLGLIHPLELEDETLQSWRNHLADHEIEPPFPQLERPVVRVRPEQHKKKILAELAGRTVNGLMFKGRMDRLGWVRGSVVDNGSVPAYLKRFAGSSVDAILRVDNMYMGIDANSEVQLEEASFVPAGTFKVGGYYWDYPAKEDDPHALRLGDVPPVVFSEVVGDLQSIAGKKDAGSDCEE